MSATKGLSDLVRQDEAELRDKSFRKAATGLAIAACFPFLAIAILSLQMGRDNALHQTLIDIFRAWSIIILAYMGGTRWGIAVQNGQSSQLNLWMSILVPCLAWVLFFLPDNYMILCLLVAYCGLGAWDNISANKGTLPLWFGKVRVYMTIIVAIAHVLAFFSLF